MKKQVVVHPVLFSLFPVIFYYAYAYDFFEFPVVITPAFVSLSLALILWWVITRLTAARKRSGLIVSAIFLALFSFGAFYKSVVVQQEGTSLADQIIWIGCGMVVSAVAFFATLRRYVVQLTYLMNFFGTVLCGLSLLSVAIPGSRALLTEDPAPESRMSNLEGHIALQGVDGPDIYYLVLDGYGRADFLQQEFGLDNSEFVNFLRQRDFVVADRSVANYPFTVPSIGSTLNFSYLEELVREDLEASQFRRYMRGLLRNNRVVRLLRGAGYSIVTIPSEYHEAHLTGADIEMSEWWHPNMFDMAILDMTPLPWLMRQAGWEVLCEIHRARILDSFEKVKQAVGLPERKFVYSHIFVGHPPFVFGDHNARANRCDTWSDGEGFFAATGMSRQEYIEGYRAQVEYLNREVKALVDSILERSSRHPVVIIQGDHGPGSRVSFTTLEGTDVEKRFSILNAYHLPGVDRELLYDTITPVNTFRVVLNEYFGTSYPMLEDKSYYYSLGRPHDFVPVESQESVVGRN